MKKISFNNRFGLTQAVLSGRKTMTRRIVPDGTPCGCWSETVKYSRYQVGDVVAIAQSYKDAGYNKGYYRDEDSLIFIYKSNTPEKDIPVSPISWSNKMFTRADLMPHHIRITDIKIERLNDITLDECIKEGIKDFGVLTEVLYGFSDFKNEIIKTFKTPREAFAALIDRVSGKGVWQSNPWVFAYTFELVD